MKSQYEHFISVQEAANIVSCDPSFIRALVKAGLIPSFKLGQRFRIPVSAIEAHFGIKIVKQSEEAC